MTEAVRADLGYLEAESRVSVDLSGCARVRLLEPEAMLFLQFGFPFVYYGGVYGPGERYARRAGERVLVARRRRPGPWTSVSLIGAHRGAPAAGRVGRSGFRRFRRPLAAPRPADRRRGRRSISDFARWDGLERLGVPGWQRGRGSA